MKAFSIMIFNDHKEKPQSFEAVVSENIDFGSSNFQLHHTGYGANKEEAVSALKNGLTELIISLELTVKSEIKS